jgi:tetratricopeptide (TPR) repeat protein
MQDAVKHHPEQLESWLGLADAQADAANVDAAMATLDEAGRRYPKDVRVPFQRGAILERTQRIAGAEQAFKAALALDPLHAPTLNYLGYMLADRGERLEEATRLIERAVEIDPGNPSYLDSLGWAWFKRGDLKKARPSLELAAQRLRRNSVVQDHHGDLLAALGDTTGAIAAWERALAGDRDQVDVAAIAAKIRRAQSAKR